VSFGVRKYPALNSGRTIQASSTSIATPPGVPNAWGAVPSRLDRLIA